MLITIDLDIEIYSDDDEGKLDDLIDDWTYEMRATRRLKQWNISYDNPFRSK